MPTYRTPPLVAFAPVSFGIVAQLKRKVRQMALKRKRYRQTAGGQGPADMDVDREPSPEPMTTPVMRDLFGATTAPSADTPMAIDDDDDQRPLSTLVDVSSTADVTAPATDAAVEDEVAERDVAGVFVEVPPPSDAASSTLAYTETETEDAGDVAAS